MMRRFSALVLAAFALSACSNSGQNASHQASPQGSPQASSGNGIRVSVTVPSTTHPGPIDGRLFVIFASADKPDPRIQILSPESTPPFFAMDVHDVQPGQAMVVDSSAAGYPVKSLTNLPPGDYNVEAFVFLYTTYHRADGHTIAAPEQWGPQVFSLQPGNPYSSVQHVHVDAGSNATISLTADKTIGVNELADLEGESQGYANDTPWLKHFRILSPTLSKWWGKPIYLGATVLLPKGYASHPNAHYPVVYNQNHFYGPIPWEFTTDRSTETPQAAAEGKRSGLGTGYEFYEAWNSAHFPRFLLVTWQHPCPFFDDSYAVNSANCGPFGDAIQNELIPAIESRYRVLRESRARIVEGGSTGGWESLVLQLQHPKFYGGAWVFDPDPIDFSAFQQIDVYRDANGFYIPSEGGGWLKYWRYFERTPRGQSLVTERDLSAYEQVMGTKGRSQYQLDGWWAIFDPAGSDGYPEPLWNMNTGVIDKSVASYMRDNGYDLVYYMKQHWPVLGPQLHGKLHFIVGDMDSYFLNLAVYKAQDFLESTTNPKSDATFTYGRPMKGHGWHPMTWAALLEQMAAQVRANTPPGESNAQWNY
ncbi:MAG TPA: alpha/beta hydrolase-fold protein [Candidatus Baltobacteraceae bacterium]|nr:alpha/beta hydrolase-fold protein [Candidatus Baltobacteraceae bacterium]